VTSPECALQAGAHIPAGGGGVCLVTRTQAVRQKEPMAYRVAVIGAGFGGIGFGMAIAARSHVLPSPAGTAACVAQQ
jgi:hypothetical protein